MSNQIRNPKSGYPRPWVIRITQAAVVVLLAFVATPASTAAEKDSWPLFRGDSSGSGVARTGLPEKPELLWKFTAKDSAFDATAVIADGTVYVGDLDKYLYAIDLATGKETWKFETEIGFLAAPAVKAGRVYVGDADGIFFCLNAKDGSVLWKHETDAEINSSANFYEDSVLFGSQDGNLTRLAAKDGKVVWKYFIEASGGIQCSPTLAKDRCFVAGCDGLLHVIDVKAGKSVATLELGDPTLSTPAVGGDTAYFGTEGGNFYAVLWAEPKIRWQFRHPKRTLAYRGSAALPPAKDGKQLVVIGGRNKLLQAFDAATGKEHWTFAAKGRIDSSPVVVGERVFVGSADGRLYAIDLMTGKKTWHYDAGGGFTASPTVAARRLVIGNENGVLYCFGKKE